ncbi:hypothetical protein [Streptomyces sp. NPDC050856]|uniref:hypothetical protein n=1 Tax=Streptomyces sp. NPDC050856 TaxID=3154939 RepID=UPI0033F07268
MVISVESTPGTALVLAAAPFGRGRLIDAVAVLPALAAVPPAALSGTDAATLVELADPLDPQAVLTRLRAVVTAPGPLSLYIAGQLHLDHKQHLPHLALARTTPATLRYTALPWHWLAGELKVRPPGATTVVVDLVADAETWQRLGTDRSVLALGDGVRLYGRVTPPPGRRRVAEPEYLKACTAIWRSGARPPLAALHHRAAEQTGTGAMLLAADRAPYSPHAPAGSHAPATPGNAAPPAPETAPDPLPAILATAHAGSHDEAATAAAAWEQHALRTHGPGSAQAIHWLEVRADLARLAGDAGRSCELWMAAARARLDRHQAEDAQDVEAAVDRAHHQWEQVRDARTAQALAPVLVALRRRVPGRRSGALQAVQRRLERWHAAPAAPPR